MAKTVGLTFPKKADEKKGPVEQPKKADTKK